MDIHSFDVDGVINLDEHGIGIKPGSAYDVIITGRSTEESFETDSFLQKHGIHNRVYYNPIPFSEKSRVSSGRHKANVINTLKSQGINVTIHFEDDIIQIKEIEKCTSGTRVIHVNHGDLIELENVRRD